jgi:hypothetical protein
MRDKRTKAELERHVDQLERENAALDDWIFNADLEPDPAKALALRAAREVARVIYRHQPVRTTDPFDFEKHINAPLMHLNSLEQRLSHLEEELGVNEG